MAIALVASGIFDNGASSVSTASHAFNAGTLTSNGVLIGFLFVGSTAITSPSMTWNGVSMFLIPSTQHNASGTGTTILFGIRNPASGSNTLSASWTTAGVAALGFLSFTGADQAADNTTFTNGTSVDNGGTTGTQSASVTTVNGDASVYLWSGGTAFSGTQTPTQDFQNNGQGSGFNYEGQHKLSTTTSDSYSVAITGTDWISGSGCHIKAAASAAIVASWYSAFEPPNSLKLRPASFQETQTALSTSAPLENNFPPLFDVVSLLKRPLGFVDHEHNIATRATPSYPGALFDPPPHLKVPPGFVDTKIAPAPVAAAVVTQDQSFHPANPLKVQPGFVHLDINIATQAPLTNHFPSLFDPVPLQKRPAGFDDRPWPIVQTPLSQFPPLFDPVSLKRRPDGFYDRPWPIVPTLPLRTDNFFPVLRLKQNIEFQQQYQNPTITAVTPPVFTLSPSFDPSVKLRPPDSSFFYTPQFIFVAPSQLKITDTTHLQLPINAILMGQQDYEEGESIIEAEEPNYRTKVKVSFGGGGKLSSNDPTFTTTTSKKGYD